MRHWPNTDLKNSFAFDMTLSSGVDVEVNVDYTITRAIPATYWQPAEGGECEWEISMVVRAHIEDQRSPPKYYELLLTADDRAELLAMAQAEANHGQLYAACYDDAEGRDH